MWVNEVEELSCDKLSVPKGLLIGSWDNLLKKW